ncbi:enhancer of polycomb-like protein 1 [Diutina catenulata]
MAVLPASAAGAHAGASKSHASSARFRQRKISVKQPLAIFKQRELASGEELEQSQINHLSAGSTAEKTRDAIETGVDKNEEDEVHLQQVIHAAQRALLGASDKSESVYIPTPDASKLWPEAAKYYRDQKFHEPDSYVKYSATVEDAVGVMYCMDEEDDAFYQTLATAAATKAAGSKRALSELEYETVCDHMERAIEVKQPFLSMDPSNLLGYDELKAAIVNEAQAHAPLKDKLAKELKYAPFVTIFDKHYDEPKKMEPVRPIAELLKLYGPQIYDFWRQRKIARKGQPIHPRLKFEDPHATEKDNDSDPYVCFRRREFRQARKTRRADTMGAERLRHLQKSLQTARELVLEVAQRELLKVDVYKSEQKVFRLRADAKAAKRAAGVKGDDHLFYPAKRQRVVEVEDEERDAGRRKKDKNGSAAVAKDRATTPTPAPAASSSTSQPYVKLPPSKIPDMDLVTVQLVLKEKNETIRRAVADKLRKRRDQDKGYVNLTDDPRQPYFSVTAHDNVVVEPSHVPYSSIAAAAYHDINTTHYLSEPLKRLVDDGHKPLPGVKTVRHGQLVPSLPFPHHESPPSGPSQAEPSYVAQLLHNIDHNSFAAYSMGYGEQWRDQQRARPDAVATAGLEPEPFMRLRKRHGRGGLFVDRRGQVPWQPAEARVTEVDDDEPMTGPPSVYNDADTARRVASRWRFDSDESEAQHGDREPFGLDPSRLNCISDDTQSIRFGSMLLSKSYGLLRESVHQRQQMYMQQARLRALQHSNKQQTAKAAMSKAALAKAPTPAPST